MQLRDVDEYIKLLENQILQSDTSFWKALVKETRCTDTNTLRMSKIDLSQTLKKEKTKLLKALYKH